MKNDIERIFNLHPIDYIYKNESLYGRHSDLNMSVFILKGKSPEFPRNYPYLNFFSLLNLSNSFVSDRGIFARARELTRLLKCLS